MTQNHKAFAALIIMGIIGVGLFLLVCSLSNSSQKLTVIHPFSFSNVAIFQASLDDPDFWNRRAVADTSQHIDIILAEGKSTPIIAVTPFTNALIFASKNKDIRIIAGAGQNGLYLVANKECNSLDDLNGKKIGTARGDSLEVFLVELMQNRSYDKPIYFDDPFVAITSLENGQLDAVTHVEPFVSQLLDKGMNRIASSKDIWGNHPDAVIVTTSDVLTKNSDIINDALKRLLRAERDVKNNPDATAKLVSSLYAPIAADQLAAILPNQPPKVDIRDEMDFFRKRFATLQFMGLIDSNVGFPEQAFDFSFLEKICDK